MVHGIVIGQDIASGKEIENGSVVTVKMQSELYGGY